MPSGRPSRAPPIGDLCRQYGIAEQTFCASKIKSVNLDVGKLRRLCQQEEETSLLKRLVADLSLDKHHLLSEALRKKSLRPARRRALAR
jgi:putative transposase